jgi:CheY-like chemotaxis protein
MSIAIAILGALVAVVAAVFVVRRGREPRREPASSEVRDDVREVPPPAPYQVQRLRILVVDDNAFVGHTVTRLLEAHEVATATSGEAALSALARDSRFDAIRYALMMPGMSGVSFAAAVAERHPALRPRMVFLINGSSTPETFRLLAVSNIPWITKPIRYAQLATCISEVAAQPAT